MATKKAKAAEKAAPAPAPAKAKKSKKPQTEEQIAKKKARMEAIKNRPPGQRTNSKQIDVIELPNGGKVMNYGYPVRGLGTLVTSVSVNSKGEVTSTAMVLVPGFTVKSKKGHGSLKPFKGGAADVEEPDTDNEVEEDED